MAALHRQKGQRENKGAEVDLKKCNDEEDGAEEDNDDDRFPNSVWAKKVHPANTV